MEFISVGPFCTTADIIKLNNFRKSSYPFDYIFSSLEMVKHCINDRFNIFLNKEYYLEGNEKKSMHHLYYSKFINTEVLRKHHLKWNMLNIANNLEKREIFLHHNLLDEETYSAFVRRCNRLLNLIDNNEKIVFVYYNCYTEDYDDIVDFSKNFSNNKNIFVIGIFENNSEKKILYENLNCKIYQNYDKVFIFNDVMNKQVA